MSSIRLPIPINNGKVYEEIDIKEIIAGVVADTNKEVDNGNPYRALQVMIAGCTEKLGEVTEKANIKNIVGTMPYKTAEYVSIKILTMDEKDDGIEGVYNCPRCNAQIICEKTEDNDTLDYLNDIEIKELKENNPIEITLSDPIEIPVKDENMSIVESMQLIHPTLNGCSNAVAKVGEKDNIRLQLAIFNESIVKVNGIEIDNKWKNRYGMYVFEHMKKKDMRNISNKLSEYGMSSEVNKHCIKCGKDYKATINTANFFVSALQSNEI